LRCWATRIHGKKIVVARCNGWGFTFGRGERIAGVEGRHSFISWTFTTVLLVEMWRREELFMAY